MDERDLTPPIDARASKTHRRRWSCPGDNQVASYLEQRLQAKERSRFEAHLADCDFCLGIVGDLVRQRRASEPAEVPVRLLQRAIEVAPARSRWKVSSKWLLVPALASILVASAVFLRSPKQGKFVASVSAPTVETARPPASIPQPQSRPAERQYVRKMTTSAPALQLMEPQAGSIVRREALRFRWGPVANATYYEIRVVNSEGDLVWQGQVSTPPAQFPPDLSLRPGKYFVWVRAYLNNDRTVKSDAVAFRIGSSS